MAKRTNAFLKSLQQGLALLLCLALIFLPGGPAAIRAEEVSTATPETMPTAPPSETASSPLPTESSTAEATSPDAETSSGNVVPSPQPEASLPESTERQPDPLFGQAFPKGPGILSILLPQAEHDSGEGEETFTDLLNSDIFASSLLAQGFPDLNPLRAEGRIERLLSPLLYLPLRGSSDAVSLLESWKFSEDGRQLELNLKDHLYWSDGELISSRDLEFTLIALMKTGVVHPGLGFVPLLQDYEQLSARADFAEPREGEKAQPFVPVSGIEALDDRRLLLSFSADARAFEEEILALQPLPAHTWWEEAPLFWQQLDRGAATVYTGSAPFVFRPDEDPRDLVLEARKNIEPQPLLQQIYLRPVPAGEVLERLLESRADIGLFPYLPAESRLRLEEAGYRLQELPSDEQVLLEQGAAGAANPFAGAHGREILRLLLPDLSDFTAAGGEHFLPLRGEKKLEASLLGLAPKERRQRAFELLLEDGWVCLGLPQEKMDSFHSQHPEVELKTFPSFAIAYDSADPALGELAYQLQLAFSEALLPIQGLALPLSGAGAADALPAYAALKLGRSCLSGTEKGPRLPLLRSTVTAAVKKGLAVSFSEKLPFLGAEGWLAQ